MEKARIVLAICLITLYACNVSKDKSEAVIGANVSPNKIIALTFDDGPSAQYTPKILDILKRNEIKATFFVIGKNVEKFPDIVKREVEEGHLVGNHSWSHPLTAPLETKKQLTLQLLRTDSAVYNAAGIHTQFFRPPHGWHTPWMVRSIESLGFYIVNWTVDPKDWKHPKSNAIIKRVEHLQGKSAIVLLHDGLELKSDPRQGNTVNALQEIIDNYKSKGYKFITIEQLINDPEFSDEYKQLFKTIRMPSSTYR